MFLTLFRDMLKKLKFTRRRVTRGWSTVVLAGGGLSSFAVASTPFTPQEAVVVETAPPGWSLLMLVGIVFTGFLSWLVYPVFRLSLKQIATAGRYQQDRFIVIGGAITTIFILLAVSGFTLQTLTVLAAPKISDEFVVEITQYDPARQSCVPENTVAPVQEIFISLNEQQVRFNGTSADMVLPAWTSDFEVNTGLISEHTEIIWLQAGQTNVY